MPVSDSLTAFLERHRCPVIASLARIHSAGDRQTELNRYLVLSTGHSQRYVQCSFIDDDKRMLCEASSGLYGPKEGEAGYYRMRPEGMSALASLGFAVNSTQGNYQLTMESPKPAAYSKVADVLLSALYQGHNLSVETPIMINMAKDQERKMENCSNLPSG